MVRWIKKYKREIVRYSIIWFLGFILLALPFGPTISLVMILPLIIPVHINFYLIDRYLKKHKYFLYGLFVCMVVFGFGIIAQGASESVGFDSSIIIKEPVIVDHYIINEIEQFHGSRFLSFNFFFNPVIAILLTTFFRYFKEKQETTIQELRLEKVQAELDFLRSQVNPHFLFNTLNNLFSIASTNNDEETANGLGRLSHLMRYILHDAKAEKLNLNREIEMIENFIELQKLRLSDEEFQNVNIRIEGETKNKQVPPLILLPFIENAFKFAVSVSDSFFISIELQSDDHFIHMIVKNSINQARASQENESSGIGLENVKRRLDLIFPDQHKLEIHNLQDTHFVSLIFPF